MEDAIWEVNLVENFLKTTPLFIQLIKNIQNLDDQQKEFVLHDVVRLTSQPNALYVNNTQLQFSTVNKVRLQKQWNEVIEKEVKDSDLKHVVLHATHQNLLIQLPINIIKELSAQQLLPLNPTGTMHNPDCVLKIKTNGNQQLEYDLTFTCRDKEEKILYECSAKIIISQSQQIDTPVKVELKSIKFIAYSPQVKHLCPTLYNRFYLNQKLKQTPAKINATPKFKKDLQKIIYSAAEKVIDYLGCDECKEFIDDITKKIYQATEKTLNRIHLSQKAEQIATGALQKAIKTILITTHKPDKDLNIKLRDDYIKEMRNLNEHNFAAALQMLHNKYLNFSAKQFYRLMTMSYMNFKIGNMTSTKAASQNIERSAKVIHKNLQKNILVKLLHQSLDADESKLLENHIKRYVETISLKLPLNLNDLDEKIFKRLILKTIITKEFSGLYAPIPEIVFNKYLDIIENFLDSNLFPETNGIKKHIKELPCIIYKISGGDIENFNSETILKDIENEIRFQNINRFIQRDLEEFSRNEHNNAWPSLYYKLVMPLLSNQAGNSRLSVSFAAACNGSIEGVLSDVEIRNMVTKNILKKVEFRSSKLFNELTVKHHRAFKSKHFNTNCTRGFFRIPLLQSKTIKFKPSEEQRKTLAKIAAIREMHYEHCKALLGDEHPKTLLAKQHFERSTVDGLTNFFNNLYLKNKSIEKIFNQYLLHQEYSACLMQNDSDKSFENEKNFLVNELLKILNHYRYANEKTKFFEQSFKKIVTIFDKYIVINDFNKTWYDNVLKECKKLLAGSVDATKQIANLSILKSQAEDFIAQQGTITQFFLKAKLKKLNLFIEEVQNYAIKNEAKLIKYRLNQSEDPIDSLDFPSNEDEQNSPPKIKTVRDSSTDTILMLLGEAPNPQQIIINPQKPQSNPHWEQKKLRLQKLAQQQSLYSGGSLAESFSLFSAINDQDSLRSATYDLAEKVVKRKLN